MTSPAPIPNLADSSPTLTSPLRGRLWWQLLTWTGLMVLLDGGTVVFALKEGRQLALSRARDSYRKDIVYRLWATQRGGVYVPLDGKTPPNPYLAHIPDREIHADNGKTYTLVNPAYMTRMVHELDAAAYGAKGHITSLNPLRPENKADAWEAKALARLEKGGTEYWEVVREGKGTALRFMGAFRVQEGCLRCHAQQGYKVGDLRGGIGVVVPMQPTFRAAFGSDDAWIHGVLGGFWVAGLSALALLHQRNRRLAHEQEATRVQRREHEQRFQVLIETLPVPVLVHRQHRIVYANPAAASLLGYPDPAALEGVDMLDCIHPDFHAVALERWRKAIEEGAINPRMEERMIRSQGEQVPVEVQGLPVTFWGEKAVATLALDLTERLEAEHHRRKLEEEVAHAQRLESLGHLAGGVAHDMNNVLAAILGLGSTLKVRAGSDAALAKAMDVIIHAAERGRDLVKGLTDFARKGLQETGQVDLNAVVKAEAALLHRTTLSKVEVRLDLEEPLPRVLGDAHALGNALMNLCVNALDAMPDGGVLRIGTRVFEDAWVDLEVQDSGEGMSAEVAQKALEPFFTTKPVGKGTGLGLSVVYGTVKSHGGQVQLESELGRGTLVRLRFPAVPPEATTLAEEAAEESASVALRILLVDDEELVREAVPELLRALGHAVETASGGAEGLQRLEEGLKVDLVILDLNMPGMSGTETLGRLRLRWPDLPVLIASGYKDAGVDRILAETPRVDVLMKPYSLDECRKALAKVAANLRQPS